MNTSKLHIIARSLKNDLEQSGSTTLIQQIVAALQQLVNQPQQPQFQQQLSASLTALYQKLEESSVEKFSPAWRDAMSELSVSNEFGVSLKIKIENIIERNQITYQIALQEITKILQEIQQTESHLNSLVQGLDYFGVGEDELQKDECEIGVIIPRKYVENNLKSFGEELVKLEKTLVVFSEIATGSREPLKVRTISSSELSIFLDYIPQVGACIAIAVERIVALYKQMLEIKKLKAELIKQNVPIDSLIGIDKHAESIVSPEIDNIAEEILEKYGSHIEKGRKNEVSTELRLSLKCLANRIDRGFNIELRASSVHIDKEEGEESTAQEAAIKQILESAKKIEYSNSSEEPVLFLEENGD